MDVEIILDGEPVKLRTTLEVGKRINAIGGGFRVVEDRLRASDLLAYIEVVAVALNKTTAEVQEKVFRTGMPYLARPLFQFIGRLGNGGKDFRPQKLKTVEIEGKTYAEVDDKGAPVYVDADPQPTPGDQAAGEV